MPKPQGKAGMWCAHAASRSSHACAVSLQAGLVCGQSGGGVPAIHEQALEGLLRWGYLNSDSTHALAVEKVKNMDSMKELNPTTTWSCHDLGWHQWAVNEDPLQAMRVSYCTDLKQ